MSQAARKDDPMTDCDGIIESDVASTVFINGISAAMKGSMSSDHSPYGPPHPPHVPNGITVGSGTVFIEGRNAARKDDPFECGHAVASGSSDVTIGDSGGGGGGSSAPAPAVEISPIQQAAVNDQTNKYKANPSSYSVESDNQTKKYYPGTPEISTGASLISTATAGDIIPFLGKILDEASKGMWDETGMGGRPSNANIVNIWKDLGFPQTGAWTDDQTAWCMGFVNFVLKKTGYRYLQTARAKDIRDRAGDYKAISVPLNSGQPGDICLWSYSHVNFIYTAVGAKYTFVGGNQSSAAKNANNPSGGSVTLSWPGGYTVPGNNSLVAIFRPVKN